MKDAKILHKRVQMYCIDGNTHREYDVTAERMKFLESNNDVISLEVDPYSGTVHSNRKRLEQIEKVESIINDNWLYENLINERDRDTLLDLIDEIKHDIEKGLEDKEAEALTKYKIGVV